MMGNPKAGLLSHSLVSFHVHRLINIENPATLLTPEVIVASGVTVETTQAARQV